MHLTNYSLNKKSDKFDSEKHKLKLSECLPMLGKFKPVEIIWREIEEIIIKTVIVAQPQLQHFYRSS